MKKFRIKQEILKPVGSNNIEAHKLYIPQYKGWLFWHGFRNENGVLMVFTKLNDAIKVIDRKIEVLREDNKIVYQISYPSNTTPET